MYHFTIGYLEPNSAIQQDFQAVVESVRFTQAAGVENGTNARIDVRVACESALAYMVFQTGAAADQFVAECVAGDYPEVIGRYINDQGLDPTII